MPTVAKIVDSEFRSGEKNGKRWVIRKIELEDGTTATGFDDVEPGDEVEVSKNDYGLQYKAVKKPAGADDDVSKVLNAIYKDVQFIKQEIKKLSGLTGEPDVPAGLFGDE